MTPAPDEGDIVWLNFDPQSGKEQAGKRPALVLSPKIYNEKVGLMVVCPITSRAKGFPFEVPLTHDLKTQGVILSDHLKSVDWNSRQASVVERVSDDVLTEVRAKVKALLSLG